MTTTTSTSRRSSSNRIDATTLAFASANGRSLHIKCSTRSDGDFHRTGVPFDVLARRRRSFVDLPWTQLDQVHGTAAVRIDAPGAADGQRGDIAVTSLDDAVLGCWVGDCAPVVLIGSGSEFAIVHAGWRGLARRVIETALAAFTETVVGAVLGPTIGPCCYEFGSADLELVAAGVGCDPSQITASTSEGRPALDVGAAVEAAVGALTLHRIGACTGCGYPGFSHRVRRDPQRHVVAVWRPSGARS